MFSLRQSSKKASVVVTAELDFEDLAEDAAVDDIPDMVERRFESAVVPEIKFSRITLQGFFKFFHSFRSEGERFFKEDDLSRLESLERIVDMFRGTDCDGDQLDIGIFKELFSIGVACTVIFFLKDSDSVRINVASGDDGEEIIELIQFGAVHIVSGASDAPETDFDWFFFHFFPLLVDSQDLELRII